MPGATEGVGAACGAARGSGAAPGATKGVRAVRGATGGSEATLGATEGVEATRGAAETTGSGVGVLGRPVGKGEIDKGGGTTGSVRNRDSSSESGAGVEEVEKGKFDSSKTTCQEMRTRREVRSKQRYPGGVRLTRTLEDTKVIVARRDTKESMMWGGSWGCCGG